MVIGSSSIMLSGRPAGAQRGEIDEQFEGRARLAPRLSGAVERRFAVVLAADHRDDPAIGPHRHQRRLRVADRSAVDRPDRQALKVGVERGLDPDLAEVGIERPLRCGATQSAK